MRGHSWDKEHEVHEYVFGEAARQELQHMNSRFEKAHKKLTRILDKVYEEEHLNIPATVTLSIIVTLGVM